MATKTTKKPTKAPKAKTSKKPTKPNAKAPIVQVEANATLSPEAQVQVLRVVISGICNALDAGQDPAMVAKNARQALTLFAKVSR